MDFGFSEEHELFRRTVRKFAKEVLAPKSAHWDRTGESAAEMRLRMGELGLTALRVPEQYGGMNADFVTCGIASEEAGRGDASCATWVQSYMINGELIARHGTEEMKEQYLRPLARGEILLALGVTEPHCGSDAAAMTTVAVRDGDEFVLTGEKSSTSNIGESPVVMIWAKTNPAAGSRGVSCFLVPADAPGLTTSRFNDIGLRAITRGAVHLDRVRVPAKNLVGEEGRGFQLILNQFDYNRAIIALGCIGLALQTIEETVEYAKTRTAFGQPIARYQGVAFPIVEALTQLEAARLLSYKTLWLRDQNLPHSKEAAMVKWWAPKLAFEAVHQMLLLHGHAGYSDDYPIGQRLRDVLGSAIGDGTAEIMKIIVAREITGGVFH